MIRAGSIFTRFSHKNYKLEGFTSRFNISYRSQLYRYASTSSNIQVVGEKLIPLINKLQERFALVGMNLDLPQIVVIGGQSSGKSSVLENLAGRDFLPRGTDIVTRRPLILHLMNIPADQPEYGEFSHRTEKFYDFQKIKDEIVHVTDAVAPNKSISSDPIVLKLYSPNVIPLSLVDTPGIARVPIGNQPSNIEEYTRNLVKEYITRKHAIILAVQPANQDLALSDALSLAKSVDTDGNRTIGVLTKLDLMDKGTDATNILLGRSFPLRLGWIAVRNRSQDEINRDKKINSARNTEDEFFEQHPLYKSLTERCGTKVLAEKCNKLLTEHIRKTLPELRKQIDANIMKLENELIIYGEPISPNDPSVGIRLLQEFARIAEKYKNAVLEGDNVVDLKGGKLSRSAGAQIRYICHDSFTENLRKIHPLSGLKKEELLAEIRNRSEMYPDSSFQVFARKQIEWLMDPSVQIAEFVHTELWKVISDIIDRDLVRFERLRERVIAETREMLRKQLKETQKMIEWTIQTEMNYINVDHPDFNRRTIIAENVDVLQNQNFQLN